MARRSDLWVALGQHLQISLIALIIAVVIAVPLAIWVQPHKRIANVLLQVTGVLQTIPSLALLGLLIPFVGIGNVPAIIALVVYALLPIFQNTYVGLADIDPAYREAERAFGMPRYLQLLRVELPLALPVIIGGIRTATVMIIGTATLAALIGAGGLGTFILLGINRNDPALTLIGAIASAALALVFSAGLAVVQRLKWRQSAGWRPSSSSSAAARQGITPGSSLKKKSWWPASSGASRRFSLTCTSSSSSRPTPTSR